MKLNSYTFSAFVLIALMSIFQGTLTGQVLYQDNFANLDPSWGTASGMLTVKDGKLVLKPALNTTQSVLNQTNVFNNADISIDVTMSGGDVNVPGGLDIPGGLVFWAKDYGDLYCLCVDAVGSFKISHYLGNRWLTPVNWTANQAINKGPNQVNRLRVVTVGDEATAYINDKQVAKIEGQPPPGGGRVGVSGGSAKDFQNVWQFANLKVAALPIASSAPQSVRNVVLRLHGSNTIGKELALAVCEDFLKHEGATFVQREAREKENETDIEAILPNESSDRLTFEIQAHGTKTAFEDMAASKCDIGMASRRIKPDEAQQCALAGLGDMFSPSCENVLGSDGIAVFVNRSNPINELTKEQLTAIFSGVVTNWSQIGAHSGAIHLYVPDDRSGTLETFGSRILGTTPLSPQASRYENSAKLSDEVAADPNGIGIAGMAFVRGSKPLALSEAGGKPLLPTPFTVATGDYLLSRRLFLYTPADSQNKWTRKFVEFALASLGGGSKLTPTGFFARKSIESARSNLEVFSWWTSGGEAAALNALFNTYQKQYPGTGILNATVAGGAGSAARPVLKIRLTVGNPPDTWQSHPGLELLEQYVEPNYCEPITDLYQSEGWYRVLPKALVDMITRDGNAYAVLTGVHRGNVLWYNKKLLAKHRIKIGQKMTFGQFFAACDKLKAAGTSALGVGDSGIWASAHLFENTLLGVVGPQGWVDLFSGKMNWDDPKVKRAMQYFAKMEDYLNRDHALLTWDQAVKELMDGKVAFTSMGDWADGEFIKAHMKEKEDFGWVSPPGTDGSFIIVADGFTLAKGAPHKGTTLAWLKSIGSKEAQEAFNPLKGSIPARIDVDRSKFDGYHKWSMAEFTRDKLLPSCVHGEAAPAAFQAALNDAIQAFMVDKNVENFANTLVQASEKAGQETIGRLGFIGQKIKVEKPEIPRGAPSHYIEETSGAGKLSLDFHFRAGGTQLDDKALTDLDDLVELLANPTYQQRRLLIFGFSDDAGNASRNLALSKDRAKAVAEQLQMRGITPALVNGFGKQLPIASNAKKDGRDKNRRVEVWLR